MDIRKILRIVKRWIWLLVLAALVGGGLGYFLSSRETPRYRTSTRFVVLRSASTGIYDYYAYVDYQNMISTYAQLLSTESLLSQVSEEVGFRVYANQASAEQLGETQFVRLTVTDTDPVKAATIANALVDVLIEQNEALQAVRYESTEANYQARADQAMEQIELLQEQIRNLSVINLDEQIAQVTAQIEDLQTQVTDLRLNIDRLNVQTPTEEQTLERLRYQAELDQITPLLDRYQEIYTNLIVMREPMENEDATSTQMAQLQRTMDLYEQIYFSSISSLETLNLARVQSAPNVVQVEPAVVPSQPYAPRPFESAGLYAAVGVIAMAGLVFLIEYLDDTIKTPEEIKQLTGLPVIGFVADLAARGVYKGSNNGNSLLFVAEQPRSAVSESLRMIRTNLEFSAIDHPIETVVITSANPSEGKSTIASNLAVIIAQGGKDVLLLDADMRRPNVHSFYNIPNRAGLSDLLRGKLDIEEVVKKVDSSKNVSVITSGSLPPNPSELLASEKMSQLLEELKERYDVIIIDSSPMVVTDPQLLASKSDGVIFIVEPGKTRSGVIESYINQLNQINARVLGVVFNRIPRSRDSYYGGYYKSYYYSGDKSKYFNDDVEKKVVS